MPVQPKAVLKMLVAVAALSVVAACAEKPKPAIDNGPPPQTDTTPQPTTPSQPPVAKPIAPVGIVPGSQQDFVVNVGDRVYFDTDMSSIRADAQDVLSAQAAWLNRYPSVKVRIEGNADERGTREYNFALGARRAEAVSEFLIGKGVAASRISTISYGKEQPIDPGTGEDAWQHNRNGHTAITSGAQ